MKICPHCQSQNQDEARFCIQCGTQLTTAPSSPTPQLSAPAESTILTPLPVETRVGEQYSVQQLLEQQPYILTYLVATDDEEFYILKETLEPGRLGAEMDMAGMALTGEGLRPPFHTFQEERNGQMHTYLVEPQPGTPLTQIGAPQELIRVVQWGVTLATGLATLHEHDIAYGQIERRTIQVDRYNGDIFLADFSATLQPGIESLYQSEVRQLALVLYEMLTGQSNYDPAAALREPVHNLLAEIIKETRPLTAAEFRDTLQKIALEVRHPLAVDLRVARQTDVGRTRPLNEDSLFVLETTWSNCSINQPMCLLIVADGMGGHQGGEIASGLAVQTIGRLAFQGLLPVATRLEEGRIDPGEWLQAAIQAANQTIVQQRLQAGTDMGSTIVATILIHDTAYIAHVGDSRAYHLHKDGIRQLTRDHSLVERLVATNQITPEEARHHPQSNVVYRTLGDKPQVEVETQVFPVPPGDYLLLCSDGLNGMLTDAEIHTLVMTAPSPQAACADLINAANEAGGTDNITVILVKPELL